MRSSLSFIRWLVVFGCAMAPLSAGAATAPATDQTLSNPSGAPGGNSGNASGTNQTNNGVAAAPGKRSVHARPHRPAGQRGGRTGGQTGGPAAYTNGAPSSQAPLSGRGSETSGK